MATPQHIGFVGLGAMGSRMARNVRRAGYPLTVYDRTPARAAEFGHDGAVVAGSVREVAAGSDVVITMLTDPEAVRAVVGGPEGLLAGARAGLVLIDMSTVGPADARALVATAAPHGVRVLHAAVLGSTGPAERGELIVLVGGEPALAEAQRPLLGAMGRSIHYLGANEHASAMKLAVNLLTAGSLQLFGEALALATHWGVAREEALAILGESPATSAALRAKAATMFEPAAPAEFALHLARKDLWLATDGGYRQAVALPLAAAALETYTLAMREHGDADVGRIAAFVATELNPPAPAPPETPRRS